MTIRKAERRNAKIKLALQGPSGSGKTYSALQIAKGLTELNNVVVVDTENYSADLYDHLQLNRHFWVGAVTTSASFDILISIAFYFLPEFDFMN